MPTDPILEQMQAYIDGWEQIGDNRRVFLTCYAMMTANMLRAVKDGEFHDGVWVNKLLRHFAMYYFEALEAYNQDPQVAPKVWRIAFDAAQNPRLQALQYLLLGVNAHINYDLVLALSDVLEPEWESLSPEQRRLRHADHCQVNTIIGRTIDGVQDQVIERFSPLMELVDRLMGTMDEWLISRLISEWREQVWQHALERLGATPTEREGLLNTVEANCLKIADSMLLQPQSKSTGTLEDASR